MGFRVRLLPYHLSHITYHISHIRYQSRFDGSAFRDKPFLGTEVISHVLSRCVIKEAEVLAHGIHEALYVYKIFTKKS
jgi:hypothetical protein